ncbi:16639_t:CDS:2, partial [Dentiscutata heterogama]
NQCRRNLLTNLELSGRTIQDNQCRRNLLKNLELSGSNIMNYSG